MPTPYERSVLDQMRSQQLRSPDNRRRVFSILSKLPQAMSSRFPVEVLALLGTAVYESIDPAGAPFLKVRLLVQRGWDRDFSLMMYKNFRLNYPTLNGYEPEALRLLNRKQLQREFSAFGDTVADVISDSECQPFFHALLFGKTETQVHRPCADVVVTVEISDDPQVDRILGASMERGLDTSIPAGIAFDLYRKATGQDLALNFSINPYEVDYAACAQAAERSARFADPH